LRCRLDAGPEDNVGGSLELYGPNEEEAVEVFAIGGVGMIELYDNFGSVGTRLDGQSGSRIAGSLGVDRIPAANDLEVEGTASKTSAGSWLANSDARIKTNVETITNALHTLSRVRPVKFSYTSEYLLQHPRLVNVAHYNVIAQEFAEVFPDSVSESGDTLPDGSRVLQVDTYPASIHALAAIRELHEMAELKERRIADLEKRFNRFEPLLALRNRIEADCANASQIRHTGPMARDFYGAFGVGMDDKHISMVDADGVALAAIKGLNQKVDERIQNGEQAIRELRAENAALKRTVDELKALVQAMNHTLNGGAQ
jgi:hypothetical protein